MDLMSSKNSKMIHEINITAYGSGMTLLCGCEWWHQ